MKIKYMGSKNRIAKYIIPIMLDGNEGKEYFYDLTVGGCNLLDKIPNTYKRVGSDVNEYLIEFLKYLQTDKKIPNNINYEIYNNVRLNKEKYAKWYVGMIGFGYTYSAKWFGGFIGNVNDKVCVGRDRIGESYRAIVKRRNNIQDIDFRTGSYDSFDLSKDSIIYIDPPYANTTKYKDKFDHEKFWDWVRKTSKDGYTIFVSEYNAPDDFECLWSKEINSSLTKNTGNKKGIEKLFKYRGEI